MLLDIALLSKTSATYLALEWPLPCVRPHVLVQVVGAGEDLLAMVTGKGAEKFGTSRLPPLRSR